MAADVNGPLVVVVGQTASGKSSLAMDLARVFGGEIIAADSRTIYTGMDTGTAKPTLADRSEIPHHLVDIVAPDAQFTVADFKRLASRAIVDIAERKKLPILVGGTGLYVDAVLFDYRFSGAADKEQRKLLEQLTVQELQHVLRNRSIPLPRNEQNKRHLIRQIETGGVNSGHSELRPDTLVIGMGVDTETLRANITTRTVHMLASGLEQEAQQLVSRYGWSAQLMHTIGYQEFAPYFAGEATITDVQQAIITNTIQYAKRQKTWFRRNKSIHWITKQVEAVELVTTFLNK